MKAIIEKDTQIDMLLDLRDFYQNSNNYDEDEDERQYPSENYNHNSYYKSNNDKGRHKSKQVFVPKEETIFLEQIKFIKYKSLRNM